VGILVFQQTFDTSLHRFDKSLSLKNPNTTYSHPSASSAHPSSALRLKVQRNQYKRLMPHWKVECGKTKFWVFTIHL